MMPWSSAVRAALSVVLFALSHSGLAALATKRAARDVAGPRRTDGLYRFGFCAVSVVTFVPLARYLWSLPDRTLYRARGALRVAMLAGQVLAILALILANRENGFGQVTGIRHLRDYLAGRPISPTPVAQHPLPEGSCLEGWRGPFRLSSHPNNYLVLVLYWLSPVMTLKWAAVGCVTAAYMVLGSIHEDRRLLHAYGERYACYRGRVPHFFLLPIDLWLRRGRGGAAISDRAA